MTKNQLTNAALDALGSRDQLKLLDLVDSLRSQGVSSYLSLPQIIVCGDQSSGKSSVLEAISGVPFPVKSSVCTRFPTELILRKTPTEGISISIVPHHSRSDVEKQSLAKFKQDLVSFADFPQLVEDAKLAMGILSNAKSFSEDILRIEIKGPNRPSLTIVDLPGLVHSENKNQTTSDIDLITNVVKRYMKEPRSIILDVISAKNDYANQIVLKLAKNADHRGVRTLGIITKPDTLNPGSESEKQFLSLARNQDVAFSLGWHVLRNADTDAETLSLAERDVMEETFFSSGAWSSLPASQLGIKTLRDRLSKLLVCQIGSELPNMVDEIEVKMRDCQSQLDKLGMARNTPYEQRLFLIHISQTFQTLVKGAVDGMYNDPYFGDAMSPLDYHKRIRAVVQNMNEGFGQDMRLRGKKNKIVMADESDLPKHARGIPRDEYMNHIVKLIERERGCELPGLYNPMIISHLFREQCQPWRAISEEHVKGVFNAVQQSLSYLVAHVTDAATVDVIMSDVIRLGLDKIQTALREKLAELLKSHYSGHPITYNDYFTETLKKIREDRRTAQIKTAIKKTWGLSDNEVASGQMSVQGDFTTFISALMSEEGEDMNRFAAGEALDCLEAYYKVRSSFHHIPTHANTVTGGDETVYRRRGCGSRRGMHCLQAGRHLQPLGSGYDVREGHCSDCQRDCRDPCLARQLSGKAKCFEERREDVQNVYL